MEVAKRYQVRMLARPKHCEHMLKDKFILFVVNTLC